MATSFQGNLSEQPLPAQRNAIAQPAAPTGQTAKVAKINAVAGIVSEGLKLFVDDDPTAAVISDVTKRAVALSEQERQGIITPAAARIARRQLGVDVRLQYRNDPVKLKAATGAVNDTFGFSPLNTQVKEQAARTNRLVSKGKGRLGDGASDEQYYTAGLKEEEDQRKFAQFEENVKQSERQELLDKREEIKTANEAVRLGSQAWMPYLQGVLNNTKNIKTEADYKRWVLKAKNDLKLRFTEFEGAITSVVSGFSKEAKEEARAEMTVLKGFLDNAIDNENGIKGTSAIMSLWKRFTTEDDMNVRDAIPLLSFMTRAGGGPQLMNFIATQSMTVGVKGKLMKQFETFFETQIEGTSPGTAERKEAEQTLSYFNLLKRTANPNGSALELSASDRKSIAEFQRKFVADHPINSKSLDADVDTMSRTLFSVSNIGTKFSVTVLNSGLFLDVLNSTDSRNKIAEITRRDPFIGEALQRSGLILAAKTMRLGLQDKTGPLELVEWDDAKLEWVVKPKKEDEGGTELIDGTIPLGIGPLQENDDALRGTSKVSTNAADVAKAMNKAKDALMHFSSADKRYASIKDPNLRLRVTIAALAELAGVKNYVKGGGIITFKDAEDVDKDAVNSVVKPSREDIEKNIIDSTYTRVGESVDTLGEAASEKFKDLRKQGNKAFQNRRVSYKSVKGKLVRYEGDD
tara:strand:+ start:70 stop:2139 length:2070 start_codon:yes stop_codon:yes gene_type:complete